MNASRQDIEDAEETAAQTGGGADATEALFNMVSICECSQTYTLTVAEGGKRQLMVPHLFQGCGLKQ